MTRNTPAGATVSPPGFSIAIAALKSTVIPSFDQNQKQRQERAVPYATANLPKSRPAFTASKRANTDPTHRAFTEISAMRRPGIFALTTGAHGPTMVAAHPVQSVMPGKTLIKNIATDKLCSFVCPFSAFDFVQRAGRAPDVVDAVVGRRERAGAYSFHLALSMLL